MEAQRKTRRHQERHGGTTGDTEAPRKTWRHNGRHGGTTGDTEAQRETRRHNGRHGGTKGDMEDFQIGMPPFSPRSLTISSDWGPFRARLGRHDILIASVTLMACIYVALVAASMIFSPVVSQDSLNTNSSIEVSLADGVKGNGTRNVDGSQRDCKNVNNVVNAGIRMNSDNITHLNIYEALNSQLVDLECSVTLLVVMEHKFKWFKSCPGDKTPQRWNDRYFVLNDAVLVSSVRVVDEICWTYRHNSRVIQVLNKSFNNCHLTCKVDLEDGISGGEKRQLNFTVTLKIVGALTDTFTTGALTDTFTTGALTDTFTTGALIDTFTTGALTDTFTTGALTDTFTKGALTDTFTTGALNDTFTTGALTDTFTTGALTDTFTTGALTDTFTKGTMIRSPQGH
ncbi:hypothetical protein Btru_021559 [Bulinus truncatus]|nr:hypothetical protein Btru_021559 [Bulinus truncatus]